MHETSDDLAALQAVLDRSYELAGNHLRDIHAPERRLSAADLAERLSGTCLLTLATTTRNGRPITGPVDGVFFRGAFHFGSSPDSLRFRHLAARPHVSATHLPGEHLAVTVHGIAARVDVDAPINSEFRETLLGIYLPQYGDAWREVMDSGVFARIEPDRIFAYAAPPEAQESR